MNARLAEIWRHPIKSHGRERVDGVTLERGRAMPWDRRWAVAHADSAAEAGEWASCRNFSITSRNPALAPFNMELSDDGRHARVSHAQIGTLEFRPDEAEERARFIEWVAPLTPEHLPRPERLLALPERGYTDSDFPSVTLCSFASHREVEAQLGDRISHLRWRGNLWVEGLEPWVELDWVGRVIRVGEAVLVGRERTDRCPATMANPETGERDAPTVRALLDGWGHKDFSIRCEVVQGGPVREGDRVEPA